MGVYGILVHQPGIEPTPLAMEAQSHNYWTTREVPRCVNSFICLSSFICFLSFICLSSYRKNVLTSP